MQRIHNPVTPFAKYSNFNKNTLFKHKNPTGVRNASIIQPLRSQNIQTISQSHSSFLKTLQTLKFQNLSKQRERSLCSLKIKILTNYPTNLITSKIIIKTLFKPKI